MTLRAKEPRKSTRRMRAVADFLMGTLTVKKERIPAKMMKGTWIRKAQRQPMLSWIAPPKSPPRPIPVP